jgi:2-polyprenyl-6-hydroxyphenyl methylase/3-demethylubiquinone-9 3-methyltransferase
MASNRDLENHFRFGENWRSFLSTVSPESIAEAEHCMRLLLPADELQGRRFLDIGSGSGLAMLAAIRLGTARADGIDLDQNSVEASRSLLTKEAPDGNWSVRRQSVFDLMPEKDGRYDVVYSWGVLHHTGDMWTAIQKASAMVAPGGRFVLALYRKTPLCSAWAVEKRFYTAAPALVQAAMRAAYKGAYRLGLLASGRNPSRCISEYRSARGMEWHHDVHDWLGGYPYQSTKPGEVVPFVEKLGFKIEKMFERPAAVKGLFGTHCDEYVAVRSGA